MLCLLPLLALAAASPVVVPVAQHHPLLHHLYYPYYPAYYPAYPIVNGRLATSPLVIDPFFDYTCKEEGIFYNPEDCASYVTCNGNAEGGIRSAKVACPPGLLFNDELKVCDWPVNVPDCATRTVATNPQPTPQPIIACNDDPTVGRTLGVNVPCVQPIIACQDGKFRIDCDPVSEAWWWTIEETDPQNFDCTGKEVGTYEHPDQCNMYYVCSSDGRAFRHTCAEGTLFSVITGECMFEEEVLCGARHAPAWLASGEDLDD